MSRPSPLKYVGYNKASVADGLAGTDDNSFITPYVLGQVIAGGGEDVTFNNVTVNGTLSVPNTPIAVSSGGTGAATLTNNGILLGKGTSAVSATAALTNGQLLIGSTGVAPVPASLTAGSNVTVTPGAGSITIAATGGLLVYTEVTATGPTSMTAANGYIANNAALVSLLLPATAALGTEIVVIGKGAGGWRITQNAGQSINVGASTSTVGVGGSVSSSAQFNAISIICTVANTTWTARSFVGTLTVV